jgi:ADP-ribose pyrophosphatase
VNREAAEPDSTTRAFEGTMVAVVVEQWGDAEREIVERADSVAVVALDPEGRVVVVRQFRDAARGSLLELPAGTVDEGEEPLATAKRELAEETGLQGGSWETGPVFFTTPGFCRERVHLFFAEGLTAGDPAPDGGEDLEVVSWPLAEIRQRLDEIEDAKTLVGLLLFLDRRT